LIYVVLSGPMNASKACRGWLQQQGKGVHLLCFTAFAGGAAVMSFLGMYV
jgi:hypothetical protein